MKKKKKASTGLQHQIKKEFSFYQWQKGYSNIFSSIS